MSQAEFDVSQLVVNVSELIFFNMAMSGKKGKKTKGKTLNLQEFLGENGGGAAGNSIVTKSWANECEDDDYAPPKIITYAIPTAPRSQRVLDDSTIPTHPPFLAYMSNLPYDLNEQDIQEYFEDATNHQVVSVRLPREDGETGRMRGFGYIEFAEREGLIAAVSLPDPQLRNRNIRIDVSTEQDQKRAGGNRGRYDNLGSSEHRDTNWRRGDGNRYQDNGESNRRSGFAYNRERQGDSAENGGNWRSGERKLDSSPPRRSGGSGSGSGSGSGGGGERYGRRNDYEDRPKREEPVPEERPRLKLNPRTLPLPEFKPQIEEREEEVEKVAPPPRPKPTPVPAAAIFGAAKPVDTAAKDREIEERLERERLQREQAEKERAEQERLQKQIELEEKEKGEEHERKDGMEREVESLRQTVRDFRADEHEQQSLDDGDAEKSNDEAADNAAPAEKEIISWRRKPDEEDTSRTQSPPRRSGRYSPDRRQQRRHNDDRRGPRDHNRRDSYNNRDKRDFNRDYQQRNDRDHHKGDGYNRDRNYNRGDKDRNQQRNQHNRDNRDSRGPPHNRDERDMKPRRPANPEEIENRMPKFKPDTKPKLQMSNTYDIFNDETSE